MIGIAFPHVTAVRHVRGHTLWLRFSDGVEGHVDLANWERVRRGEAPLPIAPLE